MNYEVKGKPLPVVICQLAGGESVICQKGAMSWMTPNMKMSTGIGGSEAGGAKGVLGTLGKMATKALTGESIFQNTYTAEGGPGEIAFASTFPGDILAIELDGMNSIVAQKRAFLAMSPSVDMSIFFQQKVSAGLVGGEGFIMQKFEGKGVVFLEIDGSVVEYELAPGQSMLVDTGYLAAMDATCTVSIDQVKGIGNALLGGEGFFNTRVTGPGKVFLQTMPTRVIADAIRPYIPTSG